MNTASPAWSGRTAAENPTSRTRCAGCLANRARRRFAGAKMEDVIFNGTEKRRRLAFCEVTLVFDNEDNALPVDYTEVAVTRRVYRSGEGEYRLNGTPCRLRDIVDLFRDTGIGKDGYSLDRTGPHRRNPLREERRPPPGIRGSGGHCQIQGPQERSSAPNGSYAADNLTRVEDILSELTERIEPLKAQSEAAREYLALRDELKMLRSERLPDAHGTLRNALQASFARAVAGTGRSHPGRQMRSWKRPGAERAIRRMETLDRLERETAEKREDSAGADSRGRSAVRARFRY